MIIEYSLSLEDLPEEIWVDIIGYENCYQISNMGRVKSLSRKDSIGRRYKSCIMRGFIDKWDYHQVILRKEGGNRGDKGEHFKIHRLVGEYFIDNPENKPTVNHKKGNKRDNRASELEWSTYSEQQLHSLKILNNKHGSLGKRNISPMIKKIDQFSKDDIYINTFNSIGEAAREVNVNYQNISAVCNGRIKTCKGFKWKFHEQPS